MSHCSPRRLLGGLILGITTMHAAHATDVGVSVSVSQPGFYGRVDIGNTRPVLVYPEPVVIAPGPHSMQARPVYLRVPPGHLKNWARHCHRYQACNQRVYFVQDDGRERSASPRHPASSHKHPKGQHPHGR